MTTLETTTTRPGSVTAAVYIQYLLIALGALAAILAAVFGERINAAAKSELEKGDATQAQVDALANIGGGGAMAIVVAIVSTAVFLTLTILVAKGKQAARIITWVLSGLSALFSTLGVLGMLVLSGLDENVARATQAGYDAVGGWYELFLMAQVVLGAVGSLTVVILLALPSSHPYFRKSQPEAVLPPEAYT